MSGLNTVTKRLSVSVDANPLFAKLLLATPRMNRGRHGPAYFLVDVRLSSKQHREVAFEIERPRAEEPR